MTNNFYQRHKERFSTEANKKYQNLSEEEKNKRRKKVLERCQNLTDEEN